MVEVNREVCVCWLVICSALEVGISVVDEINSDVLCPSVVEDNEDGEVLVVDITVSAVDPLSLVDDCNVDKHVGDIAVVNADLAVIVGSVSMVELNRVVCVCWLVVCSTVDEDISVFD